MSEGPVQTAEAPAQVGVALVGHGETASQLLAAARKILGPEAFEGVIAVDAGEGETPTFSELLCGVLNGVDQGAGVLVVVDLLGASPCQCATRQGAGHELAVLSGLNLAMLLKLGNLDRRSMRPVELAKACAESVHRAVQVTEVRRPSDRPSSSGVSSGTYPGASFEKGTGR